MCDGHSCLLCCKNRFAGFSCPAQSQRSPRLAQQVPHYPIATSGGRRRGRGGRSRSLGSTDSFFPHSRTFSRSFSVSVSVSLSPSSLSFLLSLSLSSSIYLAAEYFMQYTDHPLSARHKYLPPAVDHRLSRSLALAIRPDKIRNRNSNRDRHRHRHIYK